MSEEQTEEESSSMEEESLAQLAPPPEARGVKRDFEEKYDSNEREKKRLRLDIKSMFVVNPGLDKKVGQHSEFDAKLLPLSIEELRSMRDECYALCASNGQVHDPFKTGRAVVTIIGASLEKFLRTPGLAQRIASDQNLIARIHEILPFDPEKLGPYVEAFTSLMAHGINHFHQKEWTPQATMTPNTQPPSATSTTPPVSS